MLVDQPASDTALRVGLQDLVALEHRALIEVTGPAPNDRVEFSYPIFRRVPRHADRRFVVDFTNDRLHRPLRRLGADIGFSMTVVLRAEAIPEKVERLLREFHQRGFLFIDA